MIALPKRSFTKLGGRLQDTAGTIQSRRCTYHVPTQTAHFAEEVRLLRGSACAFTDSLIYEVRVGLARFPGAIEAYDTLRRDSYMPAVAKPTATPESYTWQIV